MDKDDLEKIFEYKYQRNGCDKAEKYKCNILFKTWELKVRGDIRKQEECVLGVNIMPFSAFWDVGDKGYL